MLANRSSRFSPLQHVHDLPLMGIQEEQLGFRAFRTSQPLSRTFHLFQGVFCTYGNQTVINLVYLLEDINHQLAIHPVIEYITVVYTIDRHVLLHANGKYPHQLI